MGRVRRTSRSLLVPLSTAVLLAIWQAPAFAWTIGRVDKNPTDLGSSLSLRVSLSDHVWIAWVHNLSDDVFWSKWTGAAWRTQQVAGIGTTGGDCESSSAAFDPLDGTARIASACSGSFDVGGDVRFIARSSTGSWTTTVVGHATTGSCRYATANTPSLAMDPSTGDPGIAYGDSGDHHVYWLHDVGSTWVKEDVGQEPLNCGTFGPAVSAAFDPVVDEPAIAWSDAASDLFYSVRDASTGSWTTTTILIGSQDLDASAPSLAFAPDATPWIAFSGISDASHQEVAGAATETGGAWTVIDVASLPFDPSFGRPSVEASVAMKGSLPRIAWVDDTDNANLRWSAFSGTAWSTSTITAAGANAHWPSPGFSSTGASYVAYQSGQPGLFWARDDGVGGRCGRSTTPRVPGTGRRSRRRLRSPVSPAPGG